MNIITLIQILIMNISTIINNQNPQKPVRLAKKEKITLTYDDFEILILIIFLLIILTSIFLLFVTSCTDSGLVYNHSLA